MSKEKRKQPRRVFIVGIDGYLGWPLALHLTRLGYAVAGVDSLARRRMVKECGSSSAIPLPQMYERPVHLRDLCGQEVITRQLDCRDHKMMLSLLGDFEPDTIVHLGEQPSAPYSQASYEQAQETQSGNIIGTLSLLWAMREVCPDAHLLKLGSMGCYGTPDCAIPEGDLVVDYEGKRVQLPFPMQPHSFYHSSKVADSTNIRFACRVWGLRSTDVMQGVVYGTRIDAMTPEGDDEPHPMLRTRFDFDESFGTAVNRFCAQAVCGHPLTPYGAGTQTRGFLPLRDSIQCMTLAIDQPPAGGEYRVINQLDQCYSIMGLARKVVQVAQEMGVETAVIKQTENPRVEAEEHFYQPESAKLRAMGYNPAGDLKTELAEMIEDLLPNEGRIRNHMESIPPRTRWK